MDTQTLIQKATDGFNTINIDNKYRLQALEFLREWLDKPQYAEYVLQIEHIINNSYWDYLLDCFYQVIPFGTGGRRGEVGIGPNRINPFTIQSSAQGHSQYLINQYKESAKERGVVLAYDIRQFFSNKYFNDNLPNPVRNLDCKTLANSAAIVYAANGLKVYIFDSFRTTPELSFAIRHLKTVGGAMFSASHNPPEHNGKKVYDEFGGQLIPPDDENLVKEVTENVSSIKTIDYDTALSNNQIQIVGKEVDDAYFDVFASLSLSSKRNIKIVFTPLHGCGNTSVLEVMKKLGFDINLDPKTGNPSGKFENVTFNIPNPEVIQSFDTTLKYAKEINADIILSSDPDADRLGVMVNHKGNWEFINGNELSGILVRYAISKKLPTLKGRGIVIKTQVTTNLVKSICKKHDVELIGDLLVGYKYIGAVMNDLDKQGKIDNFLFGAEESHGYITGNYVREKDAVPAAIWLSELAAELKENNQTLIDYLNDTYSQYGYYLNHLTEIRLPGAEGMSQIQQIQNSLRTQKPQNFGEFTVIKQEDWLDRLPIVSETDRVSKNGLVFYFSPPENTTSLKVTVRPSGTEPKIKMYYEIGSLPFAIEKIEEIKTAMLKLKTEVEIAFMTACYKYIGVDFPERGFLLFWQLPLNIKLKYFEIEPDIANLTETTNSSERQAKLDDLLAFLGSDPLQKVDDAFKARYGKSVKEHLNLI